MHFVRGTRLRPLGRWFSLASTIEVRDRRQRLLFAQSLGCPVQRVFMVLHNADLHKHRLYYIDIVLVSYLDRKVVVACPDRVVRFKC